VSDTLGWVAVATIWALNSFWWGNFLGRKSKRREIQAGLDSLMASGKLLIYVRKDGEAWPPDSEHFELEAQSVSGVSVH